MRAGLAVVAAAVLALAAPALAAAQERVEAGSLAATLDPGSARLSFGPLAGHAGLPLAFRDAGGVWHGATRATAVTREGDALVATLATSDPLGRTIAVRIAPDAEGVVALEAAGPSGATAMRAGFEAPPGERHLGFGERSNGVDQRGNEVESYVGEGAYQQGERQLITLFVPAWSIRHRDDATYFPMPWLLSTRGFGVLLDTTETSRFRLGTERPDAWSAEVDAAALRLRVFGGPRPADALRRLTERIGRQPRPAAPWFYGPWFQTGQPNEVPEERDYLKALQDAGAPVSAAETHMRYLPCGQHADRRQHERDRTAFFHSRGLATLTYFQEKVCQSYTRAFEAARERDALIRNAAGQPYVYPAYIGESNPPTRPMALIDFTAPRAQELYDLLLGEAVEDGHDGWMEDFGESMPPDGHAADGTTGAEHHNAYPVGYHRAGQSFAHRAPRPLARFVRSGWTGVHPYAPIVWGGDPTTGWGFDGLESAVMNALGMGLSGISTWGSDVGGYFALGDNRLTPELLVRWIQFGAVSTVMRTKAGGVAVPAKERPQVWEREILPHWRRWARFHTQLHPYLAAATERYRRTGMPVMAHLALAYPGDPRAEAREDEFLFGPDLLAAPVLRPGDRVRELYLPPGGWVDLWRAVRYDDRRGGLRLRGAWTVRGGRDAKVRAPLDELPLLARAGTVLPLLSPDVDTLSDYGAGAPGVVRLADRRDRLHLLAFPRGRSESALGEGERVLSVERRRRWRLTIDGTTRRTYRLQASLGTLRRPFRPCRVTVGGRPLKRGRSWTYAKRGRVLRATFRAKRATLTVRGCRAR
ncbi:MAG TPA: TIM-barrel domain-containing protein [Solirubrobacteraceae bacterium]|nr:TIM-barrel domain-containing protein [Solirubrobacteraceae bacterium]